MRGAVADPVEAGFHVAAVIEARFGSGRWDRAVDFDGQDECVAGDDVYAGFEWFELDVGIGLACEASAAACEEDGEEEKGCAYGGHWDGALCAIGAVLVAELGGLLRDCIAAILEMFTLVFYFGRSHRPIEYDKPCPL